MKRYQEAARSTAVYPGRFRRDGMVYCTMGLVGEAGEVANEVKKILRDDKGLITPERLARIFEELGDVMWYVAMLADELGLDLDAVAKNNLAKLEARYMQ